jgi:hypothetical protein
MSALYRVGQRAKSLMVAGIETIYDVTDYDVTDRLQVGSSSGAAGAKRQEG